MMKTFADVVGACGFHGGVKENLFSFVTIAMSRRMRTNDEWLLSNPRERPDYRINEAGDLLEGCVFILWSLSP
jgi:hypothetical protein